MIKKPVISICIPTFNRSEKVYKLVTEILNYKKDDLHVVVLDNCSTDDTREKMSKVDDVRFDFVTNEENIGGPLNQLKAISLAKAKFAFFCLDKDYLDHNSIGELISRTTADSNIAFGYCALNIEDPAADVFYEKGLDSVLNMGYLSQHPTGIFYDVEMYNSLDSLRKIMLDKKHFPFYPDLINAEMAMNGKSLVINFPAFYTENKEDCGKIPSFTYNESNAFFSPANRVIEFNTYLVNALELKLSKEELSKVISKLYSRGLANSTFAYKNILADVDVCAHHGMISRKVSYIELFKFNNVFSSRFMRNNVPISRLEKLGIIMRGYVKFFAKAALLK